jgi:hypothetical protein
MPASRTAPDWTRLPSRDYVQCHMPKVQYDWLHAPFTDHYIRVHTEKASGAGPGGAE